MIISEINKTLKGRPTTTLLSFNKKGKNTTPAIKGVKLGG